MGNEKSRLREENYSLEQNYYSERKKVSNLAYELEKEQKSRNRERQMSQQIERDKIFLKNMYTTIKKSDYDLQFLFKNLQDFASGFEIRMNPSQFKNQKDAFLVGLLGNFNSGKTFIFSEIFGNGAKFAQGIGQTTQGINIKVKPDQLQTSEKQILCIDTAGCGEPLQCFKDFSYTCSNYQNEIESRKKEENQIFQQLVSCESFLQEYIATNCHLVIITVDIMTREDQRFINAILAKINSRLTNKEAILVIVHNFKQLSNIKDVQTKIQKDIMNNYPTKKESKGTIEVYMDYSYGNNTPIQHLVMAQDKSEAGNHYNYNTIEYLKKLIDQSTMKLNPVDIFSNLQDYVLDNLPKYFDIEKGQLKEIKYDQSTKKYYVDILRNSHQYSRTKTLQAKEIFFDFLGRPVYSPHKTIPKYDIISTATHIALVVEMPGINSSVWNQIIKFEKKTVVKDNKNKLYISIKADRDKQYTQRCLGVGNSSDESVQKVKKLVQNPIRYERYEMNLVLTENRYQYSMKSMQASYHDGQFMLTFQKVDDYED